MTNFYKHAKKQQQKNKTGNDIIDRTRAGQ